MIFPIRLQQDCWKNWCQFEISAKAFCIGLMGSFTFLFPSLALIFIRSYSPYDGNLCPCFERWTLLLQAYRSFLINSFMLLSIWHCFWLHAHMTSFWAQMLQWCQTLNNHSVIIESVCLFFKLYSYIIIIELKCFLFRRKKWLNLIRIDLNTWKE